METVTIALATYNGAKYLAPFLRSVRAQDGADLRLVVSDDASVDDTLAIARREWPDATTVTNTGTRGVIGNFSNALAHAEGYSALADQDDVWLPGKIATLMAEMKRREAARPGAPVMVFSDLQVVDADLNVIDPSFFHWTSKNADASQFGDFLLSNHVPGCAMLINEPLRRMALPIPDDVMMHDWWLALVAAAFGSIGSVRDALIQYRQHGANTVGAPVAESPLTLWLGRLGAPMRRIQSCREHARLARRTLSAFDRRFHDTMPVEVRRTVDAMLKGGPLRRLREVSRAHTGESRAKAALLAAFF